MWRTDEVGEGDVAASLSSVEGQGVGDDDVRVGCRRRCHRGEVLSPPHAEGQGG